MINSKALKDLKTSKFYDSKFYEWLSDTSGFLFFRKLKRNLITNPIYQAKKMYGWWVNVFRDYDFDFDAHGIFVIIGYKLERTKKCLENGWAIQEPKDMKALNLAIKLAHRLKTDDYDTLAYDRMEKKYGKLNSWTTPYGTNGSVEMHFRYENVHTEEDEIAERAYKVSLYQAAAARRSREEKWLYAILHKYHRVWWD